MTPQEQIELMKFNISRYDHYYDSVNNKANFWLAFNSFAIGAVLSTYNALWALVPAAKQENFSYGVLIFTLLSIIASILILIASFPHLNTNRRMSQRKRSLLYFEDVSAMESDDYQTQLDKADLIRQNLDFTNQAHNLALGLRRKYTILSYVGPIMTAALVSLLYCVFLFTTN